MMGWVLTFYCASDQRCRLHVHPVRRVDPVHRHEDGSSGGNGRHAQQTVSGLVIVVDPDHSSLLGSLSDASDRRSHRVEIAQRSHRLGGSSKRLF